MNTTVQVRRVPNPTGKGGFKDHPELINKGGRIKNPLKEFQREEFAKMTDKEKRAYLKLVDPFNKWRMAEGNPTSEEEHKHTGDITVKLVNYGSDDTSKLQT